MKDFQNPRMVWTLATQALKEAKLHDWIMVGGETAQLKEEELEAGQGLKGIKGPEEAEQVVEGSTGRKKRGVRNGRM